MNKECSNHSVIVEVLASSSLKSGLSLSILFLEPASWTAVPATKSTLNKELLNEWIILDPGDQLMVRHIYNDSMQSGGLLFYTPGIFLPIKGMPSVLSVSGN